MNLTNFLRYHWRKIKPVPQSLNADLESDAAFMAIHQRCRSYTVTSITRQYALYQAVKYVVQSGIPGDFVECGVFRGGSAMIMAMTLMALNETHRKIYLYDTYAGMSEPSEDDSRLHGVQGGPQRKWRESQQSDHNAWCYCPLETVQENMALSGYPSNALVFVKGKVEDTIPGTMPHQISLLRLDTDFHDSTYHEMVHLYPALSAGGVLLLDDYGLWLGHRKAIDQYLQERKETMLLSRIDHAGRLGIKPCQVAAPA